MDSELVCRRTQSFVTFMLTEEEVCEVRGCSSDAEISAQKNGYDRFLDNNVEKSNQLSTFLSMKTSSE
ncbi:hypothetical protein [Candidatus Protochlamydia amoebophila]|uniref:hypothetical protein n=1 Tax=Candidatus Protochlamydia amoebophila TaxID=362787 RepID=UPI001BCA5E9B|nr:hypothetical protein [Candidatus Protochlamydia amoebophila]